MQRKHLFFLILTFLISLSALSQFKVVIDAGHGGKDPGAVGKKLREKDINLKIALRLGELIQSNHSDVKVLYTRSSDKFIPLIDRANFANRNKANLFISIHTNAAISKAAYGTETFVLGLRRSNDNFEVAKRENAVILLEDNYESKYEGFDPNSPESYIMFEMMHNTYMGQSVKFASIIQTQYKNKTSRTSRGVSQDIFLVLKNVSMPAVLTEVGFISNSNDENFLATKQGIESIAKAIFNAFTQYKDDHDRKSNGSNGNIVTETNSKDNDSTNSKQTTSTNKNLTDGKIFYRIQFLSYSKKIPQGSKQFKGLKNVESYYYKGLHRYITGSFLKQDEAKVELKKISKLFPEAFIIKMRNGERML